MPGVCVFVGGGGSFFSRPRIGGGGRGGWGGSEGEQGFGGGSAGHGRARSEDWTRRARSVDAGEESAPHLRRRIAPIVMESGHENILLKDAVALIPDGASVMIGGFMGVGTPERLIDELVRQGKRDLTVIANDNALPGIGIGKLISAGAVKKTIASHIGLNPDTQKKMLAGELEVDLVPQGTLIERIRAGGFGLGGVLTSTGVGTVVEKGKTRIEVDGKPYLLETALRADFALVDAFLADYIGNLYYALTARNFNPVMAMAADTVIVEAENIVPVGVISPDNVVTPAPVVDYIISHA